MNCIFEERVINKGEKVFSKDSKCSDLYLLTSGKVACFSLKDKRVIPLYLVEEKGVVGEDCLFGDRETFYYYAVALEECHITLIPKKDIIDVMQAGSSWIKSIFGDLSEKIYNTSSLLLEHKIQDKRLSSNYDLTDEDLKLLYQAAEA